MSTLHHEEVTVHDMYGLPARAMLNVCSCGSKCFLAYSIRLGDRGHLHLQCAECGDAYCDGSCYEHLGKDAPGDGAAIPGGSG